MLPFSRSKKSASDDKKKFNHISFPELLVYGFYRFHLNTHHTTDSMALNRMQQKSCTMHTHLIYKREGYASYLETIVLVIKSITN